MKFGIRAALLFMLLPGLCAFCPAQEDRSSGDPPPAAIEYVESNWKAFSTPEGGYSISLPGTPELKVQEQPFFGKFPQYFYHLNTGAVDYTVGYFDIMAQLDDPKTGGSLLDAELTQRLEKNKDLKLLSEKAFNIGDSEGRAWLFKDGDRIIKQRSFISGTRYYQVTLSVPRNVAFQKGKPSSNPADLTEFYQLLLKRFFDSFKLTVLPAATTPGGQKGIIRGGVINGKAISLPRPDYPMEAKAQRVQGTVSVEVIIDEDGKVISARAVSGPVLLRDASERAARKARFSSTKLSGLAVKVSGVVNFNFTL